MTIEEFWNRVTKIESGCWIWFAEGKAKYGAATLNGITDRASRIAYRLAVGPIPEWFDVLHKCDVPKCVNPDHLFLGTAQDNHNDMRAKGRGRNRFGLPYGVTPSIIKKHAEHAKQV